MKPLVCCFYYVPEFFIDICILLGTGAGGVMLPWYGTKAVLVSNILSQVTGTGKKRLPVLSLKSSLVSAPGKHDHPSSSPASAPHKEIITTPAQVPGSDITPAWESQPYGPQRTVIMSESVFVSLQSCFHYRVMRSAYGAFGLFRFLFTFV